MELLPLFGRGYVIDHVVSALKSQSEQERFKNYVAESLRAIAFNSARQESVMTMQPFIAEQKKEEGEADAKEIIDRIKKKLGG